MISEMEENKLLNKISKTDSILKLTIYIMFFIYILSLFKIILFKYNYISISYLLKSNNHGMRRLNLIPFQTFKNFYEISKSQNIMWAISNTLGNLIVFIPFGYLMPVIFKRLNKFAKVTVLSLLFSVFLETTQYIFGIGSSDIDDVILNTLGGILGFLIYKCIRKLLS